MTSFLRSELHHFNGGWRLLLAPFTVICIHVEIFLNYWRMTQNNVRSPFLALPFTTKASSRSSKHWMGLLQCARQASSWLQLDNGFTSLPGMRTLHPNYRNPQTVKWSERQDLPTDHWWPCTTRSLRCTLHMGFIVLLHLDGNKLALNIMISFRILLYIE